MKRKLLFILGSFFLAMLATFSFSACSNDENENNNDDDDIDLVINMSEEWTPIELSQEQENMASANNKFALRMLNTFYKESNDSSVFFSPMGVLFSLGMVQDGASGQTRQEIMKTLGFDGKSAEEVNLFCKKILDDAPRVDKQVSLYVANSIWTKKGFTLQQKFVADMSKYYYARAKSADFNSPNTLKEINQWTSKNTKGMVPQILDKIDPSALAYILNAIYFDAKWTQAFQTKDSYQGLFTLESGRVVPVTMMHANVTTYVGGDSILQMISLHYGHDSWSMDLFLPRKGHTIAEVVEDLAQYDYTQILHLSDETRSIKVDIPKFSLNTSYELDKLLPKMGINSLFTQDELNGIFENGSAHVSKMLQKAAIDVNETGTKASAASMSELEYGLADFPPGEDFTANSPFAFLIAERGSQTIFFAGVYTGQ